MLMIVKTSIGREEEREMVKEEKTCVSCSRVLQRGDRWGGGEEREEGEGAGSKEQ